MRTPTRTFMIMLPLLFAATPSSSPFTPTLAVAAGRRHAHRAPTKDCAPARISRVAFATWNSQSTDACSSLHGHARQVALWNQAHPTHRRYPPTRWNQAHPGHRRYHLHVDRAHAQRWQHEHQPTPAMSEALASYYSLPGNTTACGEVFYETTVGVANKTLPCGTSVEICAARCAQIPVIDRGPYVEGRTFDLTPAAGEKIGFNFTAGVQKVRYRVLG